MQIIYFPCNGRNYRIRIHPVPALIIVCAILFLITWAFVNVFFMIIN